MDTEKCLAEDLPKKCADLRNFYTFPRFTGKGIRRSYKTITQYMKAADTGACYVKYA